jgi:hypothetical protein
MAIFVNRARSRASWAPGHYTLDAKNNPFLSALLEKATGGNLFIAEVFFISTRRGAPASSSAARWARSRHVTQMMCDAMVTRLSVQVTDPRSPVRPCRLGHAAADRQRLPRVVQEHPAQVPVGRGGELGEKGWSLNKMISPHFKLELQRRCSSRSRKSRRPGIKVLSFGNFVLSISDEDKAELNKKTWPSPTTSGA